MAMALAMAMKMALAMAKDERIKIMPNPNDTQVGGEHYVKMKVQPWDAMEVWLTKEEFKGYLRGNVIKYLARCNDKGGIEDLKKARHYLTKLIDFLEGEYETN